MANKETTDDNKNVPSLETQGALFEIRVKGHLDKSWLGWLEGLDMKLLENGEMILSGHIGNQVVLMGILNRLYGLNLALLSLNEAKQRKENYG